MCAGSGGGATATAAATPGWCCRDHTAVSRIVVEIKGNESALAYVYVCVSVCACVSERPSVRVRPSSVITRFTRLPRQDGGQHGYGAIDPDREQAAGCVHAARRAYATRSTADRSGGRSERGQELRARELCRQVSIAKAYVLTLTLYFPSHSILLPS